jgi:glutamate--cysteine ligase
MLTFSCCGKESAESIAEKTQLLRGIQRGYERECLRVDGNGKLSLTFHPSGLGSKLTHPWITTDYSEALLEFITPPSADPAFPLRFLRDIHRFSASKLDQLASKEMMWAGSMPCVLSKDTEIPLADYGTSNSAKMKYVYREGLGLRYGRHMQTIAGAHYNWSLPQAFWAHLHAQCTDDTFSKLSLQDFISERYFGLIRNFLRFGWLIPYLFGASPAICESFLQGRKVDLETLVPGTFYGPYATSLRMSDLGYQNRAQDNLHVSFNSLAEYTTALEAAIRTPDPFYAELGVKHADGHWQQLNANLLQVENEFYAGIRPKRIGKRGERPAKALQTYGVEYVEVRLFDLNPMVDIGILPEQSAFADALLLMCLFRDSPPISAREQAENDENKRRIVNRGRQPDLHLLVHNREQPFRPIAHALFDDMAPFAEMLDAAYGGNNYATTLETLRQRVDNPDLTPSAQVLAAAREAGGYFKYAKHKAQQHHVSLLANPLDAASTAKFETATVESLAEQKAMEASDTVSFEDYVAAYYR